MATPTGMDAEPLGSIVCPQHQTKQKLEQPVLIFCIVCSQITDPTTRRPSYYTGAELCANCAANTGVCAICQEEL